MFMQRNLSSVISTLFVSIPFVGMNLMPTMAQPFTYNGFEFEPIPKKMCRHQFNIYEQGSMIEINGKKYRCTSQGWVRVPVLGGQSFINSQDS